MSRYEKARAIVLSSRPLGEADRIVGLFSRELGRLDAVVKGVRRTKSRWGGRLEPFGVVDLVLFRGRSLYTVTSAQLVATFSHIREDREAMAAAALACEAAAGLFGEEERHERVFNLLARALAEIDRGFDGPARSSPLRARRAHEAAPRGRLPAGARPVRALRLGRPGAGLLGRRAAASCASARSARACRSPPRRSRPCAARWSCRWPSCAPRPSDPGAEEALRHIHQLYVHETGSRLRALRFAQAQG